MSLILHSTALLRKQRLNTKAHHAAWWSMRYHGHSRHGLKLPYKPSGCATHFKSTSSVSQTTYADLPYLSDPRPRKYAPPLQRYDVFPQSIIPNDCDAWLQASNGYGHPLRRASPNTETSGSLALHCLYHKRVVPIIAAGARGVHPVLALQESGCGPLEHVSLHERSGLSSNRFTTRH